MAMTPLTEFEAMLRRNYRMIEDYREIERDQLGSRAIVLTGPLLRTHTPVQVAMRLAALMPPDAAICSLDDTVFHYSTGLNGYGRDAAAVWFVSKEWPMIDEGGSLPGYQIRVHGDVLVPMAENEERVVMDIMAHLVNSGQTIHEFKIDKRTHMLEIPRELESENTVTVRIRPRVQP